MWPTRAIKKKQKAKEMLEMAKVYKKSSSLHEFLVEIDLMLFTHVSTCMFTNPFVIYVIFSQRWINIAFPALIFTIGMGSWLMSSIIMKLIFVSIQFSLVFMHIWMYSQCVNAMNALSKVKSLEIQEMLNAKR